MNRTSGLFGWAGWLKGWGSLSKISQDHRAFSRCLKAWGGVINSLDISRIDRDERLLRGVEDEVEWRDYGADCPPEGRPRKSSIGSMARSASSDRRKGLWLMAAAQSAIQAAAQPVRILELGTCLGAGGDYLLSGAPVGSTYIGLEGSASLADFTRRRLEQHAGMDVSVEAGPFTRTLPAVIQANEPFDVVFLDGCHKGEALRGQWRELQPLLSPNAMVVVDDIRWSQDMYAAWLHLASEPQWAALDLFRMGILTPHDPAIKGGDIRRVSWRQRA